MRIALAAALVTAIVAGCEGKDESGDQGQHRVDSSAEFEGARGDVAALIEEYESAVIASDERTLCGAILDVRENHGYDEDNGGKEFCRSATATSPEREMARAGGEEAFDILVKEVAVDRKRSGVRVALARVSIGDRTEFFEVTDHEGPWQITAHSMVDRPPTAAALTECRGELTSIGALVDRRPARRGRVETPRQAVLAGPFGGGARKALAEGGTLSLATVTYRPDYRETWVVRDRRGRIVIGYPVTVWGPRSFDAASAYYCNKEGEQAYVIA